MPAVPEVALPVYCIECGNFIGTHLYGKPTGVVIDEVIYEFCTGSSPCLTQQPDPGLVSELPKREENVKYVL